MTREQELAFAILCSQNGWHKARIHEARTEIRNLIEQQAKEIEALRKALTEIAEWTDRYTSPGHPVSTVAKRALTGK